MDIFFFCFHMGSSRLRLFLGNTGVSSKHFTTQNKRYSEVENKKIGYEAGQRWSKGRKSWCVVDEKESERSVVLEEDERDQSSFVKALREAQPYRFAFTGQTFVVVLSAEIISSLCLDSILKVLQRIKPYLLIIDRAIIKHVLLNKMLITKLKWKKEKKGDIPGTIIDYAHSQNKYFKVWKTLKKYHFFKLKM